MGGISRNETLIWCAVTVFTALCVWFGSDLGPLAQYPKTWVVPLPEGLNAFMEVFVALSQPLFRAIAWVLDWPILGVRYAVSAMPWVMVVALATWLAWRVSGRGLALFTFGSLIYMVLIGYWEESVNTFSLVAISVPLAVIVGFFTGTLGFVSERAYRVIMPMLDLFQTIPAFAYLLPILLLFGFGTTVGLVASVLFSFPPMVRNTIIGLRGVPDEILESGMMSGATRQQLFWKVRVPSARRQLLLGVNQATMASLSMVIIASVIGGTNDIGWEVLSTMRRADFGASLLAGIVIALLAMVLDRLSSGIALRGAREDVSSANRPFWVVVPTLIGASLAAAWLLPALSIWPEAWQVTPQDPINDALSWFIAEFRQVLEALKSSAFFYVMLPVKLGLSKAVSPFTWGFAMTPVVTGIYATIISALAVLAWVRSHRLTFFLILLGGLVLYRGITGTPWVALTVLFPVLIWQIGGLRLALFTLATQVFLLAAGVWQPAMLSIYLCGIGVLIAFSIGSLIGIWAAENDRVSAIVRPVIDTLQTMPLFVVLIPFVMIFRIGEFTALLAIVTYAIVPAIRYTEHGLRHLPESVTEAAIAIGSTRWQRLVRVKLPLAMPSIMLGLNQTIMFGISMLVITALVGTSDLGQQIYIGLSKGDFGIGMTAGIAMAVIAILADRITQTLSRNLGQKLGLPDQAALD